MQGSSSEGVAVIQMADNKRLDEPLGHLPGEELMHLPDVVTWECQW